MTRTRLPQVFISYSHRDKKWLERLQVFLKPLERAGLVERWDDTRIDPGGKWKDQIKDAIEFSFAAILLISADFLASEFITTDELPPLLSAAKQKGLLIVPVIVSPCGFARTKELSDFQAINPNFKPVVNMRTGEREALWDRIAETIQAALPSITRPTKDSPRATVKPKQTENLLISTPQHEEKRTSKFLSTQTNIITPNLLEPDATVPQCLDSHLIVSKELYYYMVNHGLDYSDPRVDALRERDTQSEFIRSLLYSTQVVINRTHFFNNPFLFKNLLPKNKEYLASFAQLIKGVNGKQVIVPYLFNERSFSDSFPAHLSPERHQALTCLLEAIGEEVTVVRLALDDERNERLTQLILHNFHNYLISLRALRDVHLHKMASELIETRGGISQKDFRTFKRQIHKLSNYAVRKMDAPLTRSDIYRDFFVEGPNKADKLESMLRGRFRKPSADSPFLFEIKKLVDLRYNTLLPDFLGLCAFSSVGLPSRSVLQEFTIWQSKVISEEVDAFIESLFKMFKETTPTFADSQRAIILPRLSDLTVTDIVDIRQLPEWNDFAAAQQGILANPLPIVDRFKEFQDRLDAFHSALSTWYFNKYTGKRAEGIYFNHVSVALNIAGYLFMFSSVYSPQYWEKSTPVITGPSLRTLQEVGESSGFRIMLIVNVIDCETREVNRDRSYRIDLINSHSKLTGNEVMDLIKSIECQRSS